MGRWLGSRTLGRAGKGWRARGSGARDRGPGPRAGPRRAAPLTVHGQSGSGGPRRGGGTGSSGGVDGSDQLRLAGTSGGCPAHFRRRHLSREDGGRVRKQWRCRGDRARRPGGGLCDPFGLRSAQSAGAGAAGSGRRGGALTYGPERKQTQTRER